MGRLAHSQGAGELKGDTGPAGGMRFPGPGTPTWLGPRSAVPPPRPAPPTVARAINSASLLNGAPSREMAQLVICERLKASCYYLTAKWDPQELEEYVLPTSTSFGVLAGERSVLRCYGRRGWGGGMGPSQRTARGRGGRQLLRVVSCHWLLLWRWSGHHGLQQTFTPRSRRLGGGPGLVASASWARGQSTGCKLSLASAAGPASCTAGASQARPPCAPGCGGEGRPFSGWSRVSLGGAGGRGNLTLAHLSQLAKEPAPWG